MGIPKEKEKEKGTESLFRKIITELPKPEERFGHSSLLS